MTGAEHYAEAERLLWQAETATCANHEGENPEGALLIAEAQVHATLAQAAAIVDRELCEDWRPWRDALAAGGES